MGGGPASIALLVAAFATGIAAADQSQGDPRIDYMLQCQGCHGADGRPQPSADVPGLIDLVPLFLGTAEGRDYLVRVPGVSQAPLGDAAIARLMNWVLTNMRSTKEPVAFEPYTAEEVARSRARGPLDVAATRARLLTR